MSDKTWSKVNELDKTIRRIAEGGNLFGAETVTLVTIEFIWGFELFNTRHYHNYESWSGGYRVSGRGLIVEKEDLDDAINEWARRVEEAAENK